jgi:ceramide glucosyltransferase
MLVFYFFAAIVIWLGILSFRDGIRFFHYVRSELERPPPEFTPFASIIAPCRGIDQGLHENLTALFQQDYSHYEVIFVTDSRDDPSLTVINDVVTSAGDSNHTSARIVIAGKTTDSGQKVHNLRVAVTEIDSRCEVLVFVDTDARPDRGWLRSLVAPLRNGLVGAATGYRWFVPVKGGLASHLRSVWNASIASALGANVEKNFCWGGSTAIRRQTFEKLNIRNLWQGTVSDDFTMTRALKAAKMPIHFVPRCLTPSFEDCALRELFEFTTRQLKITRTYAAHLWKAVLTGSLLFSLVFFGGMVFIVVRLASGLSIVVPTILLLIICILGTAKSHVRMRAVQMPLASYRQELRRTWPAHLLLWPVTSVLYLYNALAAAFSRRIEWRGITYELKSPTEAVIIRETDSVCTYNAE